jgi:octaprenyl-diphosphate synthase
LKEIYAPVEKELDAVVETITGALRDAEGDVLEMSNHALLSRGKMLRPVLVLLCAKASGEEIKEEALRFAAGVELLHMASLVHDDIMDMSETRHNMPTANSKWGSYAAMLYGDFLITSAVEQLSYCRASIINSTSRYMKQMYHGQTAQLINRDNLELSEKAYQEIIEKKTAVLFEAACELGAKTGNEKHSSDLKKFAYQHHLPVG